MKLLLASTIALFSLITGFSQEFVPTSLNLATLSVSQCTVCDGGCTVLMPDFNEYSYRWSDEDGNIILNETSTTGQSSIDNLCLGSYQIIVSSTNGVIEETFFSITEQDVNLGSPGSIYSCTNFESVPLSNHLPDGADIGGAWTDQSNQSTEVLSTENTTAGIHGIYTYSINNAGCNNYVQIPVVVNEPASVGEIGNIIACQNWNSFDFWDFADPDNYPDPNGYFTDENLTEVSSVFSPLDSIPNTQYDYYYVLDTVLGCDPLYDPILVTLDALNNAGEDQLVPICSLNETSVDLTVYRDGNADPNGDWYTLTSQPFSGVLYDQEIQEGLYRYTAVNSSSTCPPDVSYVELVFIDEIEAGQNNTISVCSTDAEFNLTDRLTGNPGEYGVWYDENGGEVSDLFDPQTGDGGTFSYRVEGVGCITETASLTINHEQFDSAGDDYTETFCESGSLLNLGDYLSTGASLNGVWEENGVSLASPAIVSSPSVRVFTYKMNHIYCPVEEAEIEIIVEDNPAFPEIDTLFVCSTDDPVNLDLLTELNPIWSQNWTDNANQPTGNWFDPASQGSSDFNLNVNPNNSCPSLEIPVRIELEENTFVSNSSSPQICSVEQQVNLDSYLDNITAASDYHWEMNNQLLNSNIIEPVIGTITYKAVEEGLQACESSEFVVNLEVIAFNSAGDNQINNVCQSPTIIELNDFVSVSGIWHLEGALMNNTSFPVLESNSGVYSFLASNEAICPSSEMELILNIQEPFDYSPLENIETCIGMEVELISPLTSSEYITTWNVNGQDLESDVIELDGLSSEDYIFNYTISDGICQITDQVNVTILDEFFVSIEGPSSVCSGEIATFNASSSILSNWSFNGNAIASGSSSVDFVAISNGIVSLSAENVFGCTAEDTHDLSVNITPQVSINQFPLAQCAPYSVNLVNTFNTNPNNTYQWNIDGELFMGDSYNLEVNPGDVIDVKLSAFDENGCYSEVSLDSPIEGWERPHASFVVSDNDLSYLNPIAEFTNTSTEHIYSDWLIDGVIEESNQEFWQHEFPTTQYSGYTVCLEIENQYGCLDDHCEFVFVNTELIVYMPNAFSPDNDGVNEVLYPEISGHSKEDYELTIFDRWGELIFHSIDLNERWNGNVNGGNHYASSGVYTYQLNVKSEFTAELKSFTGHITLLR